MSNDIIADTLTRIRNAQAARHMSVKVFNSKLVAQLLDVLKAEGYIDSYEKVDKVADKSARKGSDGQPATVHSEYKVFLKYDRNGFPAITQLKRKSRPGLRLYAGADNLTSVNSGLGVAIISTSQGVVSDREARKRGIGGEVIATVF